MSTRRLVELVLRQHLEADVGPLPAGAAAAAASATQQRLEVAAAPVRRATAVVAAVVDLLPGATAERVLALPLPGVAEVVRVVRSTAAMEALDGEPDRHGPGRAEP